MYLVILRIVRAIYVFDIYFLIPKLTIVIFINPMKVSRYLNIF